jgi:MEMO1 family protein
METIAPFPAYATSPATLRAQINDLLAKAPACTIEGHILAVIVPDTNALEAGPVAAEVYRCLEDHDGQTVFVIAPSHTGTFRRMTICKPGRYRTPLGDVAINDRLRNELCDEDDDIFLDNRGHFHREGIGVQLPFLQNVLEGFDIVPIVMGEETPEFCRELGHAVGEIMYNRPSVVVATADILGGSPESFQRFRQYFEALDVPRLMALLNSEALHVRGKGPLLAAMLAALHRRANGAQILSLNPPEEGHPGAFGAIIYKS